VSGYSDDTLGIGIHHADKMPMRFVVKMAPVDEVNFFAGGKDIDLHGKRV